MAGKRGETSAQGKRTAPPAAMPSVGNNGGLKNQAKEKGGAQIGEGEKLIAS